MKNREISEISGIVLGFATAATVQAIFPSAAAGKNVIAQVTYFLGNATIGLTTAAATKAAVTPVIEETLDKYVPSNK